MTSHFPEQEKTDSKSGKWVLPECSLHTSVQPCANFSPATTRGSQVPVKPSTSYRCPPGWHHGRREAALIDLALTSSCFLLPMLLEQMTELLWGYCFLFLICHHKDEKRKKWNDAVTVLRLLFWSTQHLFREPPFAILILCGLAIEMITLAREPGDSATVLGSDMSIWFKSSQLKFSLRICCNSPQKGILFSWVHFE